MICTLLAEAVVIAKRMIWTLLAEAVVSVVAEAMIWTPLAEKTHDDQFDAKTMSGMPATETAQMRRL